MSKKYIADLFVVTGKTANDILRGDGSTSIFTSSQVYKGTWNANTNTPTLADGTGTAGWWYRCTTAGTFNTVAYSVGDDIIYSGTVWEKIPGVGYTLQTATDIVLGGVKIGGGVTITAGVISVSTNYEAPISVGTTSQYWSGNKTWQTLPTTLPASDVYAWAKAAVKPSYTKSEVGLGNVPNTDFTAAVALNTAKETNIAHPLVQTAVPTGALFTDTVYTHPTGDGNLHVIATGTTNSGKVLTAGATAGSLSWIAPTVYQPVGSYVLTSDTRLSDARIASDVYAWAKAAVKPSYIYSEVGAEPAFTKNTAFNKNFGTLAGTVAQGNDSRINNGQTAYGWGNHASSGYLTSYTDTNTYPTDFTWYNATTSGPYGRLTGGGLDINTGAIPSASSTISGIITTGSQILSGNKVFTGNVTSGNSITNEADTYTGTAKASQIVTCSQAEYNAIGTKNANTLYVII